jgi:DNA-binding MarR family transcriptional regulator
MPTKRHTLSSVYTRTTPFGPLSGTGPSHGGSAKFATLTLLAAQSDFDAPSLAQARTCSLAAAGMLLLRLTRQGLIKRAFDSDDRLYFYQLTAKGRARLAYLTNHTPRR